MTLHERGFRPNCRGECTTCSGREGECQLIPVTLGTLDSPWDCNVLSAIGIVTAYGYGHGLMTQSSLADDQWHVWRLDFDDQVRALAPLKKTIIIAYLPGMDEGLRIGVDLPEGEVLGVEWLRQFGEALTTGVVMIDSEDGYLVIRAC